MSVAPARVQRRPLMQPTSREAWRDHQPQGLKRRILALLATGPMTDAELGAVLSDVPASAISGDRRHLVERGLVHATAEKRPTPRGKPAIVWALGASPDTFQSAAVPPFVRPNAITEQIEFPGVRG